MEKNYVPYQESIRLKEIGFDEPCMFCYRGSEDLYCLQLGGYVYEMSLDTNTSLNKFEVNKTEQYWIAAPLFSDAFVWLFNHLNIDKGVMPLDFDSKLMLLHELMDKLTSKK